MSRRHAELVADIDARTVHIRDIGSLLGTYVNDESRRIDKDTTCQLCDGDLVRFGSTIFRGASSSHQLCVRVRIEYLDRVSIAHCTARRVSSPEDTEDSDGDDPRVAAIDSTRSGVGAKVSRPEVIDLTSPSPTRSAILPATTRGSRRLALSPVFRQGTEAEGFRGYAEDGDLDGSDAESDNLSEAQGFATSSDSEGDQRDVWSDGYSSDEESLAEDSDGQSLWGAERDDLDVEDDLDADSAAAPAPNDAPLMTSYSRPPGAACIHPPLPAVAPLASGNNTVTAKSSLSSLERHVVEVMGANTGARDCSEVRQVDESPAVHQETSKRYQSPSDMPVAPEASAPACRAHVRTSAVAKRKAADMSTVRADAAWRSAQSPRSTGKEDGAFQTAAIDGRRSLEAADQRLVSLPPASRPHSTDDEQRPKKKARAIAERVGYAALGGATVGVVMLGSLIRTAPSLL
ncbi:hypothetical protein NKR23_g10912 [Pleurostoma richardsiae]|uniref:FHA domain-containing protein n=1 Tax=Pleurostoma richardsiae TaxID=41990 RepID=A0AA38R8X5_9PEZI|nr:hypothetical protein NKR23_g10912 [Pleurostoma richardsiae]